MARVQRLSHEMVVEFITAWRRFTLRDMTLPILSAVSSTARRWRMAGWWSA